MIKKKSQKRFLHHLWTGFDFLFSNQPKTSSTTLIIYKFAVSVYSIGSVFELAFIQSAAFFILQIDWKIDCNKFQIES